MRRIALLALAAGLAGWTPARAAESYDNCTGFVDSLPATISKQGVWCLRKDLSTAMASGTAISVAANNVTIDCNGFKVGGLAAGDASQAIGISPAVDWTVPSFAEAHNTVVRNCNIRGFQYGILLSGNGGQVEDNRLDNNLSVGIAMLGDNHLARRNRVFDTGLATADSAWGIAASGSVVDNVVAGVLARHHATGISTDTIGSIARDNVVRNLVVVNDDDYQYAFAVGISSREGSRVSDNLLYRGEDAANVTSLGVAGVETGSGKSPTCDRNSIHGFDTAMSACVNAGGNIAE